MTTLNTPETELVELSAIKPYWRNPRRIPPEAIESVKSSLERYGYQQPIVVDTDNVVVVGHTRLYAMQQMGVERVEVYRTDMPETKAKEYRLLDNRTGELSSWDHSALVVELREWEQNLLEQFFPDVDLEIAQIEDSMVTASDVDAATEKVLEVNAAPEVLLTKVVCPSCFHEFDVRTDSLPGLSRTDLAEMADGGVG
jgi:ParB-like chromosome segregation protein Spo0J